MKELHQRIEIEKTLLKVSSLLSDKNIEYHLSGAYRRGEETMTSMDMIIFYLGDIPRILTENSYCFQSLKYKGRTRGIIGLSYIIDGIPFNFFTGFEDELGALQIHITGSLLLLRLLRARAKKLGHKLNQYGLWEYQNKIAGSNEEYIFKMLGVEYIPPEHRNVDAKSFLKYCKE